MGRGGRYREVHSNLKVKEVNLVKRRLIVCLNEEEAREDAAVGESLLKRLREILDRGDPTSSHTCRSPITSPSKRISPESFKATHAFPVV